MKDGNKEKVNRICDETKIYEKINTTGGRDIEKRMFRSEITRGGKWKLKIYTERPIRTVKWKWRRRRRRE